MNKSLRIAITLPYLYTVRDFLFTPVWDEMAKRKDIQFLLLCGNEQVGDIVSGRGCPNIQFVTFPPRVPMSSGGMRRLCDLPTQSWIARFGRLERQYLADSLGQRFAAVNNLSHYWIRQIRSTQERQRQRIISDYRKGTAIARPFPQSRLLFQFLYEIRYGFPNAVRKHHVAFLRHLRPDLFAFGRLHYKETAYWARALRRCRIPMIGIVSSWDHPTTKGPTPRGMSGYVVASRRMVEEMASLHGIDRDKIYQTGKVQMDIYSDRSALASRRDFLDTLGVPPDNRLVTFGPNTTGLKEHEVSIARKLSRDFAAGHYGRATLLIRAHPQDVNWQTDFLPLSHPPQVLCSRASSFGIGAEDSLSNSQNDQVLLGNLMKHSDIVIQSRGSLALDAIAFDTPVISLAFDGDLARSSNDSFLLEYEFEHYKPLVTARGTWMVGSYEELGRAISEYLSDPQLDSEGRATIREEHIEPLDGKASQRLVDCLVDSAVRAREGTLHRGDWRYRGLGDTKWASRQVCSVHDYVRGETAHSEVLQVSNDGGLP